jgi:hypothetical protein
MTVARRPITARKAAASWIPADWDDVTPAWMAAALEHHYPGVEVAGVTVLERDDGTNRRARLGVTYAGEAGPDVVFVKAEGAHREVHARNGNIFNESDLFASGLPLVVDHPVPYHVVIDRAALDYVIVMEDVTRRGADPRDATRPMSVDQVEHGVRDLARLHSKYWGLSPASRPQLTWLQTWEPTEGWQAGLGARIPTGVPRASEVLPRAVSALSSEAFLRHWARAVLTYRTGVLTLLHADAHIGNTYVLPENRVGFLDWQVCRRGNWSQDLAYFLVGSLTVEDRRVGEDRLIDAYLDALEVPAGERPSREEISLRYRASNAYGLGIWLSTLGSEGYQRREVSLCLTERYAAAFADWESLAALDLLGV